MVQKKIKIYLSDLVHNYLGAGTFMFPLNIGYVGAWAKKIFPEDIDIELFKYPDELINQLKKAAPDIVGFSNFNWNADLSNQISKWIKSLYPETIILFGGPNIDYSSESYKRFFSSRPSVDFYLPYQGETPFTNLLREIFNRGLNLSALKSQPIDGLVFYNKNSDSIVQGNDVPRIKDVDSIPSPYLTGLMDKFFETNLIPIIETNRGCPFSCIYCCQGLSSHHKMEFYGLERVKEELKYVSQRTKKTNILLFADSNFGIAERDIEIAKYVAKLGEQFGYPRVLRVNWAKNQPKIFEIAKILKNINLVASLQSLDEKVLKNIKRQNIEISIFRDIIDRVNEEGGMSGTEIILGLPGETKESHIQSLKKLFDWNVSYIICYNCIVLEGSELSLLVRSGEFKCKTKFQLIDNSFGKYNGITSFESLEGIRSTPTMSEEEILYFRPVHWLIQFLWNYRFYYDLLKYLQSLGINPLDYIIKLIDRVENNAPRKVKKIFQEFEKEAKEEWFDSREELYQHYNQPENFDWIRNGGYGKMNGKYIFKILLEAKEDFEKYLYDVAVNICSSKKQEIREILSFLSAAIIDLTGDWEENCKEKIISFKYDILEWRKSKYQKNLEELYHSEDAKFILYLPSDQKQSLQTLFKQYKHENTNVTLRKMSEYMYINDFFLKPKPVSSVIEKE